MGKIKVVYDTNTLIDNATVLLDERYLPVLPFKVIQELDGLKRNPDLKRAAQAALKLIEYQQSQDALEVVNIPTLGETPDEIIIQAAKEHNCSFNSGDIGAKLIARSVNVPLIDDIIDDTIDYQYTGYIEIDVDGDIDYETHWKHLKEVMPIEVLEKFKLELQANQYLIVNRTGGSYDIWKESLGKVIRISQSSKPLRSAGIIDNPLDAIQQCAIDAVMDGSVPLTVLDGTLGTGKTLLSLMGALATTRGQKNFKQYKKIFVTRPPVATDRKLEVGFLPGTLEEKLGDWLGGIKSNLKFLYEKDLVATTNEDAESNFEKHFEMINIASIQGVSLHEVILIVDEYQLLDTDTLKLVLSRIAQGAKVVLVGDTVGQTYGVNRSNEGFKTLYRYLGKDKVMSYIKLDNIYRSELSEFVDKVFK